MRASRAWRNQLPAAVFACLTAGVAAEEGGNWGGTFVPAEPWKESEVLLPPWPAEKRLRRLYLDRASFPFTVHVDPDSISVGADGVVRYALVIVSSSGAWNVSYEGIRCRKGEYRRYAYGSGGQWQELPASPWRRVIDDGRDSYRYAIYEDYMCDVAGADPNENAILARIRNRPGQTYRDD